MGLGVGVVLVIQLANQSSIGSFENSLEEISGKTNLIITGANGVDELLLPRLQTLAGRDTKLSPVIEGTAAVAASGEVIRVLGIDILEDRSFREFAQLGGSLWGRDSLLQLIDPKAIYVTESFASRNGLQAGSAITLGTNDREERYTVRGILAPRGAAKAMSGSIAVMDIAAAQLAFGRIGKLDRVDLIVPPAAFAAAESSLAASLPGGLRVERPA